MNYKFKNLVILFAIIALFFSSFVLAEDLATQCAGILESSSGCSSSMDDDECKELLQKCSDYYDEQSTAISEDLTKTAAQKATLQGQVSALKNKITNLEYQINQSNVKVKSLNYQIADTQTSITQATEDINSSQVQISNILRTIHEADQTPSFVVLIEGSLSDFFSNIAYLENLDSKVGELLDSTKDLQNYLTGQKEKMDTEVDSLQKTIALQSSQKSEIAANKKEQETYLTMTEAQYNQQLASKVDIESKKAKIQSMLFSLAGTDDTEAPSFGEAIEVAKSVGSLVGIRPAFLLAIISQESAIGKNVGKCYLTDTTTGNGKNASGAVATRIMKPTRDVSPFLTITESLGKDYSKTPVSCWIPAYVSGQAYGWGGAMGPAQFIASTWMLYNNKIESLLNKTPNPWAIKDAFTASGLYLADLGATKKTVAAEKTAASKYYGGSAAYANSVAYRTACIQSFMDDGDFTYDTGCQARILGI